MQRISTILLLAAILHACGGGGNSGGNNSPVNTPPPITNEPDHEPNPNTDPDLNNPDRNPVPGTMPPKNTIIEGTGTNAAYVDPCGENENEDPATHDCETIPLPINPNPCIRTNTTEWNHNLCGQQIIRETAQRATTTSIALAQGTNLETTIRNLGTHDIAAIGAATNLTLQKNIAENNTETLYIAGAHTRLSGLNTAVGQANNGIIVASSRAPTSSETVCPTGSTPTSTSSPKCIQVDLARGRDARQHAGGDFVYFATSSSWAVAKLAGYAALLREAFSLTLGRDLVSSIQDGADSSNVFQLSQALETGNFGGIQYRHGSAVENFDGTATVQEDTPMGWTSLALTGNKPVFPTTGKYPLRFAVQADIGTKSGPNPPESALVALQWQSLTIGAINERNTFLGKPTQHTLGGTNGRWTWLGYQDTLNLRQWTLGIALEGGIGKADADDSPIVEDYGTILTSAWNAKALYRGEGWHTSFNVHQPPRTERARIRLRHGEGTVGTRPGRELRFTARLGIGPWLLSGGYVHEPGHDERAQRQRGARIDYRIQW